MGMRDASSSTLDVHETTIHYNLDNPDEAAILLWTILKPSLELGACIVALRKSSKLYDELKASYMHKRYDSILTWDFRKDSPSKPAPQAENALSIYLTELRPHIELLVKGELGIPTWTPPESLKSQLDPQTITYLTELKMPHINGKPNLLLHSLGNFAKEPHLQTRVQKVFMPDSPNHTIIVNTSGSGKTRLLLEGLCQNWGIYLTSTVDSSRLGSSDVENAIEKSIPHAPGFTSPLPPPTKPEYGSMLKKNEAIAKSVFSRLFLARVLIFDLFVKVMNDVFDSEQLEDYRRRWLFLQLQPSISGKSDPFNELALKLVSYSDTSVDTETDRLLSNIRATLSLKSSGPSTSGCLPLYCVIDEAQFAATKHTEAFRSSSTANAVTRPILHPLVKAISTLALGQDVFLILAGTGLSLSSVDATVASAVMKEPRFRQCFDTGAFDGWDGMASWVERYIPNWVLAGEQGERLKERMGYWLSGRHRFAAGYVTELLVHGFRQPHRLLNAYIHQFTEFEPTDGQTAVTKEQKEAGPVTVEKRYKLDFAKLAKNNGMMDTIQHILTHYLIRSILPGPLGTDEELFVEYGFARFKYAESEADHRVTRSKPTNMTVTIDEPLVVLAAYRWIDEDYRSNRSIYQNFTRDFRNHSPSSNGFENYIVYCIDHLFATSRKVKDVFKFYGETPSWAELSAELVSLYAPPRWQHWHSSSASPNVTLTPEQATVKHTKYSGPSATLGINAKTLPDTLKWLSHQLRPPTRKWQVTVGCFASQNRSLVANKIVEEAVRSVTPKYFFMQKNGRAFAPTTYPKLVQDTTNQLAALPNKCEAGKYGLLRAIVTFPARTDLKHYAAGLDQQAEEDLHDVDDGHPIAALNINLVKQLTQMMSPTNFLESLERKTGSGKKKNRLKRRRGSGADGNREGTRGRKKRKINI